MSFEWGRFSVTHAVLDARWPLDLEHVFALVNIHTGNSCGMPTTSKRVAESDPLCGVSRSQFALVANVRNRRLHSP